MKSTVLAAAAVTLLAPLCFSETVTLRSGKVVDDTVLTIDAASVALGGGKTLARQEVSEIQFSAPLAEKKQEAVSAASPEDVRTAKEAFARARELARAYPGVNGLVLLDSGETRLNPDGTTFYRNHQVRQILKDSLKQDWGRVAVCAEEGRDRVKITKASVYLPDGRIFPLDPSQVKTAKPQSEGGDFFETGSVCTQYALPNLQIGAIVDYETVSETFNPFRKDFFFPSWGFQDYEGPVARSEITVALPEGTSFYYSVKNFAGLGTEAPVVVSSGGVTAYSWKLENVPPIIGEPSMPSYADIAPYMNGSILKDWTPIFEWLSALYEERTKPSPELTEFTRGLIKDCRTDEEKAAKIYHYVQKEIRYISVKVGVASGSGGYDANLTWKRRYGCCVDKALLLTTMLKVAGISSTPIVINTNDKADVNFSIPHLEYDHAITAAEIGGRHVFLDSTNFDYRYPEIAAFDYGVSVINVFGRKIDFVPVPVPSENGSYYDFSVNLSSSGAAAITERMRYTGSREGGLRGYYRSLKKEEQKQAFQGFAKAIAPSALLTSYEVNNAEEIEKPYSMGYDFTVPDYPQRAGNILIVKLPDFEIEPYRISEISLAKRRYPIEYEASMGRYQRYEFSLPENLEVVSLPEKITLAGKYASYSAECSQPAKGRITCSAAWERPARVVPPQDYAEYKAFIEKAASYTKSQIYLRDLAAEGK